MASKPQSERIMAVIRGCDCDLRVLFEEAEDENVQRRRRQMISFLRGYLFSVSEMGTVY